MMIWQLLGIALVLMIPACLFWVYNNGPRSIYFSKGWNLVYSFYPPLLRILEKAHIHQGRQDFLIGTVNLKDIKKITKHLQKEGFEPAILSWSDSHEILNMRKPDQHHFQYHLRIHNDGEVRAHYEYSSEGSPFGHIFSSHFVNKKSFFYNLLGDFIKKAREDTFK